jgi:hypothetical protein
MGYGAEDDNTVIELTYNYGKTDYSKGNAYAQVLAHSPQPHCDPPLTAHDDAYSHDCAAWGMFAS